MGVDVMALLTRHLPGILKELNMVYDVPRSRPNVRGLLAKAEVFEQGAVTSRVGTLPSRP